jgi:hypothetical protein
MRLRHPNIPSRLALALAACVLSALALIPGATGGAGDYPSPLYLSGSPSSLSGSYKLTATAGPGIPTQTPTVAVGGAGNLTSGGLNYAYRYTVVTGDGESPPSPISSSLAVTAQQIVVGNLPTGVTVRLYRRKGSTGLFQRVTVPDLVDNPSPSYTDNIPDATVNSQGQLPLTQNRVAFVFGGVCGATNCGWTEFAPGVPLGLNNNSPMSAAAPTAPTAKGWLVDLPAGVHFATGDWTFHVRTQSGPSASGTARLVIGLWEVDSAGTAVGPALVDPAAAGEHTATNLIDNTNAPKTITHVIPNVPAFTLEPGNRLYVQFWRHQTMPYATANNDARVITVHSNDGVSSLEHPSVSTLPDVPTLASPADGSVTSSRSLSGFFSDPDAGDSGSLEFRVCASPAAAGVECSPLVDSGFSATVANGAPGSWTAGAALGHATPYYWQARDVDALGGRSAWTATRSFILDEAPDVPMLAAPANEAVTSSRSLSAFFSDPDAGDSGALEFRVCTSPAAAGVECSPVVDSGSSTTVANGAPGSWTAGTALAHGTTYYWQARSVDTLGGRSGWTATRSFILNDAPASPSLSLPLAGALVRSASPALRAAYVDSDGDAGVVRFRVCLASSEAGVACARPVAAGLSGETLNGATATWQPGSVLRDRTYFWQARSEDAFGVLSAWSETRKLVVAHRLLRIASPTRVTCVVGAKLYVNLRLAASARVSARLYTKSRFDLARRYGLHARGSFTLALRLPYTLERPAVYWIRWIAVRSGERRVASMRLDLRPGTGGTPPTC